MFVEDIIAAAYRESQIIAITGTPTALETTEALNRFNSILRSVAGHEVGCELTDLPIGGEFDQSARITDGVPDDTRLVFNLAAAMTVYLDPHPYDGQRFAVADAGANFATNILTIDGNGRMIEIEESITIETNGAAVQWLYRADLGSWVRLTALDTTDDMPFPEEFDDYFIARLAMRLNPRHGAKTASETAMELARQESRLQARYRKPRPVQDWATHGLLGQERRYLGGELL